MYKEDYSKAQNWTDKKYILKLSEEQYENWERMRQEFAADDFHDLITLGIQILEVVAKWRKTQVNQDISQLSDQIEAIRSCG